MGSFRYVIQTIFFLSTLYSKSRFNKISISKSFLKFNWLFLCVGEHIRVFRYSLTALP